MRLSKNFSAQRTYTRRNATRKGINNNPNEDNIENLQRLCDTFYNQLETTSVKLCRCQWVS